MINILNKKITTYIILALIVIIATFLRFHQLGVNPPSLTWDEASLGYNAYSILKTGADEYGNKFPLSIRSFDDYKPPLYIYLTIPSIVFFGLNEFSVRFSSAIFGVITIFITYFLVKELLNNWDEKTKKIIALISMFFVAISPWHLQFSRAAFEGNIGLFFFILGAFFFFKGICNGKLLVLSAVSFVLSLYSYHSFRLVVPIFIFLTIILYWKELIKERLHLGIFIVILLLLASPIFISLLSTQGAGSRLSMVTIFDNSDTLERSIKQLEFDKINKDYLGLLFHNRRVVYGLAIIKGYLDHFNPDFLFLHGDGGRQHHAVDVGMLYLWELPFILIGIYFLLKRLNKKISVLFILFLIAPIPSAITTGTPHPVRAIAMIPPFHIFTAVGITTFYLWAMHKKIILKLLLLTFTFSLFSFNFLYYFHQYYVHTPVEYGDFWQYGYKQIMRYAKEHESRSDKIIITYKYDQPYIYYLFYNRIDPSWYQKNWDYNKNGNVDRFKRIIGKYEFRDIDWSKDKNIPNALIIASPNEVPQATAAVREIRFPDWRLAFRIIET